MTRKPFTIAIALGLFTSFTTAADLPPGIVAEKPTEGRAVSIDDGPWKGHWMVAYTERFRGPNGEAMAIEFEPIPGGEFKMGSPPDESGRDENEGPQVRVHVEPYWIGRYEITWDDFDPWLTLYQRAKDDQEQKVALDSKIDAVSIPTMIWDQDALPIITEMGREGGYPASHMSQFNARQYTKWVSRLTTRFYRLPTEAEWEYAARAGTDTAYHFGDDAERLKDYAWFKSNSLWDDPERGHWEYDGLGYRKVGQKKPNPWGLYDMYGNVAEWCIDQRVADHYAKVKAKGEPIAAADAIAWPIEYYGRTMRGGHWNSKENECRSAARLADSKKWINQDPQLPKSAWFYTEFWLGFRPVRPLVAPDAETQSKFWAPDTEDLDIRLRELKQARIVVKPQPKKSE